MVLFLPGLLADIIEPYENLTGSENLVVIFSGGKKKMLKPSARRLLSDSCRMRYATIPHTTLCSEVARSEQPWGERNTFCPAGLSSQQVNTTVWPQHLQLPSLHYRKSSEHRTSSPQSPSSPSTAQSRQGRRRTTAISLTEECPG